MTPTVVYQAAAVFVAGAASSDAIVSAVIAGAFMLMNTIVTYVLTRARVDRRNADRKDDGQRRESDQ